MSPNFDLGIGQFCPVSPLILYNFTQPNLDEYRLKYYQIFLLNVAIVIYTIWRSVTILHIRHRKLGGLVSLSAHGIFRSGCT